MKRLLSILFFLGLVGGCFAEEKGPSSVAAFIDSLDQKQRSLAALPFEDAGRETWHYLPAASWARPGISLGDLSLEQKILLFDILKAHLSETGYAKSLRIIGLEDVLAEASGNKDFRDSKKYYVAFYGNPETDALWAWSFEGHHLSLNFTISEGKTAMTPRFLGANPATIKAGTRKGERTLAKEQDLGLELIHSMNMDQQAKAVFRAEAFPEIVTTHESRVEPLQAVGISYAELKEPQRTLLMSLIHEYLATMPNELAQQRMASLAREEIDEIRFGWAGATAAGKGHYYRIQGKSFLIEYDNTQNKANHIHTVWRDFDGDFGRDLIKEHYASGHTH
jgi:hypothetical protein